MKTLLLVTALSCSSLAYGTVITQDTSETSSSLTEYLGESFTTPSGGPWSGIGFNFYSDIPAATPSAAGTAYLLSQAYTGDPAGLSNSVPGFIAASTGVSGGKYLFSPGVELMANTMYWIFENGSMKASGGNAIAGAAAYFSTSATTDFIAAIGAPQTANFAVTGTFVTTSTTPEPSSAEVSLIGISGVLAAVMSRRRRRSI